MSRRAGGTGEVDCRARGEGRAEPGQLLVLVGEVRGDMEGSGTVTWALLLLMLRVARRLISGEWYECCGERLEVAEEAVMSLELGRLGTRAWTAGPGDALAGEAEAGPVVMEWKVQTHTEQEV